jgi:hypothetical protein
LRLDSGDDAGLCGRYEEGIAEGHPIHSEDDSLEAGGPESRSCGGSLCEERVSVGVANAEGPLIGSEGVGIGDSEGDFGVATYESADGNRGFRRDEGVRDEGWGTGEALVEGLGDAVGTVAAPAAPASIAAPAAIAAEASLAASSTAIIWVGRGTAEALARRAHATAATAAFSASPP